jgi:Fur family peroxide stress response transcriptional regulator
MTPDSEFIKVKLTEKGLRVTPQRMAIMEAIYSLGNHPAAEQIITYIRKTYPNIATGTVYKVLDVLVENELIHRVKTDGDHMRYDAITNMHHHLYATDSSIIVDYTDEQLDAILTEYFKNKNIPDFEIKEIRLHINGKFLNNANT